MPPDCYAAYAFLETPHGQPMRRLLTARSLLLRHAARSVCTLITRGPRLHQTLACLAYPALFAPSAQRDDRAHAIARHECDETTNEEQKHLIHEKPRPKCRLKCRAVTHSTTTMAIAVSPIRKARIEMTKKKSFIFLECLSSALASHIAYRCSSPVKRRVNIAG